MHIFLFPICAFISYLFFGPFGILTAWISVLLYSSMVSTWIMTVAFMPEILKQVYDSVLCREGRDNMVLKSKLERVEEKPLLTQIQEIWLKTPYFAAVRLPRFILREILLILVGLVPGYGPILALCLRAPKKGMRCHKRYFELKGWNKQQSREYFQNNRGKYGGFGTVALVLEMVPYLTIFFMFTNTVGIALWSVELEKNEETTEQVGNREGLRVVESNTKNCPI